MFLYASLTVLATGVLGVLLFAPIPPTPWGPQLSTLFDFGHFVLFAAMMLFLWRAFQRKIGLSLCVSVGIAGLCEAGQFLSGRTVCVPDFYRGVLGALFAAVIVDAYSQPRTFGRRACHLVLALMLAAWPVAEIVPLLVDACAECRALRTISGPGRPRQEAAGSPSCKASLRFRSGANDRFVFSGGDHPPLQRSGQLPAHPGQCWIADEVVSLMRIAFEVV